MAATGREGKAGTQGLRARGGAQSSHQEGGPGPLTEGAGSSGARARAARGPNHPAGVARALPGAGGRHSRLDRGRAPEAGPRSRGGEPAHPVTLRPSAPCLPLPRPRCRPRGPGPAPAVPRSAWPAAGAALTRSQAAFRTRGSPSVGFGAATHTSPGPPPGGAPRSPVPPRRWARVGWVSRDVHLARRALLPPWDPWPLWFADKGRQESFLKKKILAHFIILFFLRTGCYIVLLF